MNNNIVERTKISELGLGNRFSSLHRFRDFDRSNQNKHLI